MKNRSFDREFFFVHMPIVHWCAHRKADAPLNLHTSTRN